MYIRCKKGAGTRMHKCSVWSRKIYYFSYLSRISLKETTILFEYKQAFFSITGSTYLYIYKRKIYLPNCESDKPPNSYPFVLLIYLRLIDGI